MSYSETMSLVLGLVAIGLTLVAIIQTNRANRFQKALAESQGAFKKSNLELSLFGIGNAEEFILALPLLSGVMPAITLTYDIVNTGESSARDVDVYLRKSKDLRYGSLSHVEATGTPKEFKLKIVNETDHTQTIVGSIENLHPGQKLSIHDKIDIKAATIYEEQVSIPTKDKKEFAISYWLHFAYELNFSIAQLDRSSISKRFQISIVDTSRKSVKEFFDEYNEIIFADFKDRQDSVEKVSRWKRYFSPKAYKPKRFKLLIVDVDIKELEKIQQARTGTINPETFTVCDGVAGEKGYFIPAMKVYWPD